MIGDRPKNETTRACGPAASSGLSCLILHGLGGGSYEMEPLTAALRNTGFDVEAPVLPGHEGPGPKMPASSWKDWAATASASFDKLARRGVSVAVIGFSTGGTLVLELCTRRPVARQVLMAPFLAIRYTRMLPLRPVAYVRHLARFMPDLPRRPPAVRDPKMRNWVARADRFETFSLHAASSALELIDTVIPRVPGITTPSLILQGQLDTVVEPQCAVWLYKTLGSRDKTFVSLSQSDHLLALDRDREQVIEAILAFLSHPVAGLKPQQPRGPQRFDHG